MPENEEENLTPATRLLEKRREMAEIESALAAEKEVSQQQLTTSQHNQINSWSNNIVVVVGIIR